MTLNKNLTSVLLASTILIGSSFIGATDAQASSWMVKKVSKSSSPYCAMIKRYSNNRVISFAQRDSAQISAAIDFGDKFLDKGRAYSITLSDSTGFSRRFEVKPASSSAVVVKLNSKDPILDHIAKNGDLNVNIAGVVSTFNVADLQDGLNTLESCYTGADLRSADASSSMAQKLATISPASGGDQPATQSSASHSLYSKTANAKINQLEDSNELLKTELKSKEAKIAALENALSTNKSATKVSKTNLVGELAALKNTVDVQSVEIDQLKLQISANNEKIAYYQGMESQYQAVQGQLSAAESNLTQSMERSNALSAQIATLQSNGARASEQAVLMGTLNAELSGLKMANANLTQEINSLRQSAAQSQAQIQQQMEQQSQVSGQQANASIAQKNAEIQNLHLALQNAQSTIQTLEQGIAAVQTAAGSSADVVDLEDFSILGSQLKNAEMEKQNLQAELSTLKRQLDMDKSSITIARLEKAIDQSNIALNRAGKENAALYQKFVSLENELTKAKQARVGDANWDMKKATNRLDEAQREIRRLAMHLENNQKQCDVEKQHIEAMLFDPKITDKKQQGKLSALETKIHALSKAQQSCKQQVADLESGYSSEVDKLAAIQANAPVSSAAQVANIQPAAGALLPAATNVKNLPQKEDRSIALVSVLNDANVKMNQELAGYTTSITLDNASFDQGYSWQSGKISGSYERFSIKGGSLQNWSESYNNVLAGQCNGDFAVMPSKKSNTAISANDTACVTGNFGTTSSVVFTKTGDFLEVYKLSGTIEDMTQLMDSREKISSSVKKSL
jgi:hypothetical protein